MNNKFWRVGAFTVNTLILAVAGILMIPALISAGGPAGWASVAVGQAVGGFGGVLIGFGWGITGPAQVAQASGREWELYAESLRGRLAISAGALPAVALIAFLITPEFSLESAIAAITTSSVAFSATWYFVGTASPWLLLTVDGIPRAVATGLAIYALSISKSMAIGILVQLIGIVLAALISTVVIHRGNSTKTNRSSKRRLSEVLNDQRAGVSTSIVAITFSSLPLIFVQILSPSALAQFAIIDKLLKLGSSSLAPIVATAQGWVPRGSNRYVRLARAKTLRRFTTSTALISVCPLAVLAYFAASSLSGNEIALEPVPALLVGILGAMTFMEALVGRATLPALGMSRDLARATIIAAISGLTAVAAGTSSLGLYGALGGVGIGLLVMIGLEIRAARRPLRTQDEAE